MLEIGCTFGCVLVSEDRLSGAPTADLTNDPETGVKANPLELAAAKGYHDPVIHCYYSMTMEPEQERGEAPRTHIPMPDQ